MGLRALFSAASRFLGAKEPEPEDGAQALPPFARSFVQNLRADVDLRAAFCRLADAEPLRRKEIVTSWLRSRKPAPDNDVDSLCSYLGDEQGFRSLLIILEDESSLDREGKSPRGRTTRLAS